MSTLLDSLRNARWDTAFRTYGNNHSTLVGLLVDWWVSGNPSSRWALEGGPSFGYNPGGVGGGLCDAVLGEGGASLGIIEVEGTRYDYTIDKLGKFFASEYTEMATLEFGIFLAYAYNPVGRGEQRYIPPLPVDEFVNRARAITASHPRKQIVVLALNKTYERHRSGPRHRNEYYWGSPSELLGALIENGQVTATSSLFRPHEVSAS